MRILIVDDNDIALEMLKHALMDKGYDVTTAHDGTEAIEHLATGSYRFVISDWNMPGVNGLELCRRIRADQFAGYVYVILLTSREQRQDIVKGLSAGADDFMTKPFDPAELEVRVRVGERLLSMETRDVAIFSMAKLAESRDPETGRHLERMRIYSRILAQHLVNNNPYGEPLGNDYAQLIYLTSPLHDIGKVGIPDSVLLKAGRLSQREFDIMKTHTTIGAETLGAAARQYPRVTYLQLARDIALTHHERFNGTGYPAGLAGEQIPLCGRIVALGDVYDALISKRVYKAAFTHDVARNMIFEEAGEHFDPVVVEAFAANEEEFLSAGQKLVDDEAMLV